MRALSLLPFLLVTSCFAVPYKRATSVPLSSLLTLPPSFAKPSTTVFVALVTGFYNYTCSEKGTWEFGGSSGSAFDVSNLSSSNEINTIPSDAFNDMLNSHSPDPFDPSFAARIENKYGIKLVGIYSDTGGFSNPVVDFTSSGGSFVVTSITAEAKSPDPTAVDWLDLRAMTGSLARTVLFIRTVGGQAPNGSCEPGTPDAISQFCALLWAFS